MSHFIKQKKSRWHILLKAGLATLLCIPVVSYLFFNQIFIIPSNDEIKVISPISLASQSVNSEAKLNVNTFESSCYVNQLGGILDINGELKILSWNIYKQNRSNLYAELTSLSQGRQLVMLQEASLNSIFLNWLKLDSWYAIQANAFSVEGQSAGVLIAASRPAQQVCAYRQLEPWLRLPKSTLIATYQLSSGASLMVVDLHAVNFTLGMEDFDAQITKIERVLSTYSGPLIWAGDFNSWSENRLVRLQLMREKLNLKEVTFEPDLRSRFINGLVLDHVYYRGVNLKEAKVVESNASDHNPIVATFSIITKSN
jgi:endonuclease/exonuclease/phosphatase (EEP) superfamily protein YafD